MQMTTSYCMSSLLSVSSRNPKATVPRVPEKALASAQQIYQHTVALAAVKQQPISADYLEENITKLCRFTSQHISLLGWAGFQALQRSPIGPYRALATSIRQSAVRFSFLLILIPRP